MSARAGEQRDAPDEVCDCQAAQPSQVISVLAAACTAALLEVRGHLDQASWLRHIAVSYGHDLKLRHDFARMQSDPDDIYAAFDFFVTAEHIVDWLHPDAPGSSQRAERERIRSSSPMLEIVSHIANGAKHFVALAKHHTSVAELEQKSGGFSPTAFSPRAFSPAAFQMAGLHIHLADGSVVHALPLAEDVLTHWDHALGI